MATVNLTWSYDDGGNAISDYVDHGNVGNGNSTPGQKVFVRHDGENEITGVGFFIREFTGTYNGDATSNADIIELLGWGDQNTAAAFGGIMTHWGADESGEFSSNWPAYDDKAPLSASVYRTGVGDSAQNAITLPTTTGALNEGQVDAGDTPGVRFLMRATVPSDEDTVGERLFDHVAKYSYTS